MVMTVHDEFISFDQICQRRKAYPTLTGLFEEREKKLQNARVSLNQTFELTMRLKELD